MVANATASDKEAATEQQAQEKLRSLLPKEVIEVFDKSFKEFAKVQIHAGLKLLAHEDVVVESPTGSGKTLAFLLPALTIMKRKPKWDPTEIGLLVICPSRDLALQIAQVGQPFAEALGYSLHATIGGKKIDTDLKKIHAGVNILIATPGRLERLIDGDLREGKLKRMLRCVEILIVDEADKFTEVSFSASMNTILPCLPKQRRTGLFSATQAKDKVDLAPFTLRSPAYIKLADQKDVISPSSLSAFYATVKADEKLCALIEFIRSVPDKKVLVFFASCQCVQYFSLILPRILSKRKIFAVHGKNKKSRFTQMTEFRKAECAVMLSTDLMSRGIDIHDLDWVVHFDIPKKSSWFVHRCGRAGRNGREGSSVLIATPGQTAYVNFIKQHEHLEMKEMKLKTVTELKAEQLRQKVVGFASKSREILEHGTSAYVSWLKASTTNDAHIVCKFKELDIIGHAHSFGLLRLPKCKETYERDVTAFKRSEIDTSTIQYENKSLEEKRKETRAKNEKRKDIYKEKEANDPRAQLKKKIKEKREGKNKKNKGEKKTNEKKKMEVDEKENGDEKKVEVGEKRKMKSDKKEKTKKIKVESMEVDE